MKFRAPSSGILATILIAGAAIVATPAGAVTITNGSFEDGTLSTNSFIELAAGSSAITGWTIGGGGVDWIYTYWNASDGLRSLDLSRLSAGTISQELTGLTVGQEYKIEFDLSGNPAGGDSIKTVQLGAAVGGLSFNFDVTGNTLPAINWITYSLVFTASAATALLEFTSLENNAYGPALDNVRISAVPLPSAALLLGGAIAGFGGLFRLRRKSGSA